MTTLTRLTITEICQLTRAADDMRAELEHQVATIDGKHTLPKPTDWLNIHAARRDTPGAWWKVSNQIAPSSNLSPQTALAIAGAYRHAAMQAVVMNADWAIALPANMTVKNRSLKTGIATLTHTPNGRPYEWSLTMHHSDEWLDDTPLNSLPSGTRIGETIVLGEVRHIGFYGRTTQARTIYASTKLSPATGGTTERN